jgi:DNA-binding MarR family transcriptional regulator
MGLYKKFIKARKRLVLLFILVVAVALFAMPFVPVSGSSTNTISLSNPGTSLQINDTVNVKNYTAIVTDPSLTKTTIVLQGSSKTVVELPKESVVVKLPDNRLAIKYESAQTSILPTGSTVSIIQGNPIVEVPQQSRALMVSKIVESPLWNFTTKTVFYQSVQELNSYNVQVIFFELVRDVPDDPLVSYMIDWGDGARETHTQNNVSISHVYQNSGDYTLKINASDQLGFTYTTTQTLTVSFEGNVAHSYFWVKKNKEPVAMVSTTGLGLLLIGLAAFTESGKYKLLMLFTLMLPLYTRIQKEDVLDQFVRGQIYGYIKTNPGAHYNQILRQVGVKNGTLSYHLGVLEKTQLIQSRREGLKYRAFYPTGMMFPKEERFRLTELQIQTIALIKGRPGLTQKEIARMLGQKPQTINYNIKVLAQAGLIHVTKKGRKTRCFPVADSEISIQ